MPISENIATIRASLPAGVDLVAVSKFRPVEAIGEAYSAGQRVFGESRPQEMAAKHAFFAASPGPFTDLSWHQIGHLQSNKVKLIAPFVELIHSGDSARLLGEIDRQARLNNRTIDVLLEIRIARETTKHGWEFGELVEWLATDEWRGMSGVRLRGVMGMASNTDDEVVVRAEFTRLAEMHAELGERFFTACSERNDSHADFDIISAGMSGDYRVAVECGSTMVRVGGSIFGD